MFKIYVYETGEAPKLVKVVNSEEEARQWEGYRFGYFYAWERVEEDKK